MRAVSHARCLVTALLAVLATFLPSSCDGGESRAEGETRRASQLPPTGHEEADLAELLEAFAPVDPTATSDVHDANLHRRRAVLERLREEGGPHLGRRALEVWREDPDRPAAVRYALLEVAAHGAPEDAAPVLEDLVVTYGSADLGARTEAVRLLAETSPARALEVLEPLVLEERPSATRPDQAALLRGWLVAARSAGPVEARVPAAVAVSLFQPPEARYVAIGALGEIGGTLAAAALEEVLVEATSDGLVRRKAAQALVRCVPSAELCPILERVAGHESDPHFLNFLGEMLDDNCAE